MKKRKFSPILSGRYTKVPSNNRYEPDDYEDRGKELPEEEKEYDRNTSIGTLKLIMKLGFKISK